MSPKSASIFIDGLEDFINERIIQRPDTYFQKIESFAKEKKIPILNPMAGQNLAYRIRDWKPAKILELGTGAGYSLHWMLAYLKSEVQIFTYERNPELLEAVQILWKESSYYTRANVDFRLGSIPDAIRRDALQPEEFDLIFVDTDKITYPEVFRWWTGEWDSREYGISEDTRNSKISEVQKSVKLPPILFDNALWHGRVLQPDPRKQSDLKIQELWELAKNSGKKYELIPSGDGILVVYGD